jgi:hypothetical protein
MRTSTKIRVRTANSVTVAETSRLAMKAYMGGPLLSMLPLLLLLDTASALAGVAFTSPVVSLYGE